MDILKVGPTHLLVNWKQASPLKTGTLIWLQKKMVAGPLAERGRDVFREGGTEKIRFLNANFEMPISYPRRTIRKWLKKPGGWGRGQSW